MHRNNNNNKKNNQNNNKTPRGETTKTTTTSIARKETRMKTSRTIATRLRTTWLILIPRTATSTEKITKRLTLIKKKGKRLE